MMNALHSVQEREILRIEKKRAHIHLISLITLYTLFPPYLHTSIPPYLILGGLHHAGSLLRGVAS